MLWWFGFDCKSKQKVMQKQFVSMQMGQRKKKGVDINGCGKNEDKKVSKPSKMLINTFQN